MSQNSETKSHMLEVAKPYHDINTPFSIDEKGALAEYVINDPEKMPQLALGASILIRDRKTEGIVTNDYKDFWYAGRIIGLKAVSPFNPERTSMLYQEDNLMDPTVPLEEINGPHTHQPMVIQVALTRELSPIAGKPGEFVDSAVQRPPSGHSRLFFPKLKHEDDDPSPTLKDILRVKDKGLNLGMIGFGNKPYGWNDREFIEYKWDIDRLDNKHIFIVGESGSGKTVFLKNLAYEIRKHDSKNKIILTDVQGDISQLLFWDFVDHIQPSGWQPEIDEKVYEQAKQLFGKFRLIVPMTRDPYADSEVASLIKLAQKRSVDVRRISLRFQDLDSPRDAEYLFRTSSEQAALLIEDIADGLKSSGEPASLSRLQTAISRLLARNTTPQITIPTNGISYYRSTFEASKRALRSLEEYFDMDPTGLQEEKNPLDDFDFDGTTILYLDHLNQDERLMWEMQLVSWLYKKKKHMQDTYVFFDEAHQIIPATNSSGSNGSAEVFSRLRSNFEKLAREGRKFRLNLVLSTQNPQDLHPIVPEQCPTRVVMKINPKNAQYAFLDKELAYVANSFSQGQFWIQSPFNGTPDWVRVHSVAPPIPHSSMDIFRQKRLQMALKEK
ncbi:ATP-binding protein [Pseudoflavitalea sp. X16]|uniref:ATP-binding protein n=1 Tax=Paraflavitalea devenefica TaxID=2716334 RepID=UPI0014241D80|nr:ATP-binding protein [Paraflavitalea devenefica]NII27591.1 ATP-binding protein [Paraflavitalea devenefica]